jgi:hypothetical protein
MTTLDDLSVDQLQALYAQKTDPHVAAIHSIESNGASMTANPVNPASGASGSMQTMKDTARDPGFGVKPSNGTPIDNSRTGVEYYQAMKQKYGDPIKAAVAYDWGPGNADKWIANGAKLDDLPLETLQYIQKFDQKTGALTKQAPATPTAAQQQAPVADTQPDWQAPDTGIGGRIVMGLGDFLRPAARAVVSGLGAVGDQLSPGGDFATGAHQAVAQMDAQTKSQNAKFAAKQQAEGKVVPGTDWVRTAAGIAPAFLVPGGAAETLGGRVLMGMGQGAVLGAGATEEGQSYAKNAALGALTGGAGAGVADVAGRVIRGAKLSPYVQKMVDMGVTPTPGQTLGGVARSLEEKSASLPAYGEAVKSGERAAVSQMNRGLYKNIMDDVAMPPPPADATVAEATHYIGTNLKQAYNQLLPSMSLRADQQFGQDMQKLVPDYAKLPADMRDTFNTILNDNILTQTSRTGALNGADLQAAKSALSNEISTYGRSSAPNDLRMANLLRQTRDILREAIARQNPQQAPQLAAIDSAYAKYKILQNAAARVTNPENPIMPGQLQAAIKSMDKSQNKRAFAEGTARMKDISDAAVAALGNKVADSGTAGRMYLGLGLGGGIGLVHPGALAAMGAGAAAYGTPLGRQAMFAALAKRPEFARLLGGALQGAAPQIGGASALYGVNNQ